MAQPGFPGPIPGVDQPKKMSPVVIVVIVVGVVFVVGIAVVGVLGALAVYGVRGYVDAAKKAEGRNALGQIGIGIGQCMSGASVLALPTPALPTELPPTTRPVPASLAEIAGRKYMSSPSDWDQPAWKCMRFELRDPQYFQYQWERTSATTGVAHARADLDGDGKLDADFEMMVDCTQAGLGLDCGLSPHIIER